MDTLIVDAKSCLIIVFVWAVAVITMITLAFTLSKLAALRQCYYIRKQLFASVLTLDMTWSDLNQSGTNFSAKINEESKKFEDAIGANLIIFVMFFVHVLGCFTYSFCRVWELTLMSGIVVPLNIIVSAIMVRLETSSALAEVMDSARAGVVATEAITNIRTVVAYNAEQKLIDRYKEKLDSVSKGAMRRAALGSVASAVSWCMTFLTYVITFMYGARMPIPEDTAVHGTVFNMTLVLTTVWISIIRFTSSQRLVGKFMTGTAAAASIFPVLDARSTINPLSPDGNIVEKCTGQIQLRNVSFSYPARPSTQVLKEVFLTINPGDFVAFVGSSGSGKTTILQLVQRFYDPLSGKLLVDGVDLKDINVKWWRQQIGVVGQEACLFAGTIEDNIRFGRLNASEKDIVAAAKNANAHDFILNQSNGYKTVIGARGGTLSGGEKQRIAIARALVRQPSILLLDEPTSALDAPSREVVTAALSKASKGRTTLMVTHRLSSAKEANKIVVMKHGQIVEHGTHEQLISVNGFYAELLRVEAELAKVEAADPSEEKKEMEKFVIRETDAWSLREEDENNAVADDAFDEGPPGSLKSILTWNKPEWGYIILGFTFAATSGALLQFGNVIFGDVLGSYELTSVTEVIAQVDYYSYIIFGAMAAMFFIQIIQQLAFAHARERLVTRLRLRAFTCTLHQEAGWFDDIRNNVGSIVSRISQDTTAVYQIAGPGAAMMFQALCNFSIGLILSLYYSWKLALVTTATLPIMFLGIMYDNRMQHQDDLSDFTILEEASRIASEALANKRTVASLGLEELFIKRYNDALEGTKSTWLKSSIIRGFVFSLGQTLYGFGNVLCIAYGTYLISTENEEYTNVIKIAELLLYGAVLLASEFIFTPNLATAKTAAARLQKLFQRRPLITDGDVDALPNAEPEEKINLKQITFAYPTRPTKEVLRGVSLTLKEGQSVVLVGPSGSGKSSVLNLILRLYDPTTGEVFLNSTNLRTLKLSTLRGHLGLVSQEPTIFSGTIKENIELGDTTRQLTMAEIIEAARAANIHEFVSSLPSGYETVLGTSAELSGGQKQRIAIARALIRDPKVLLLDEATSALDPENERVVQQALDKVATGRTTVTVAHRLAAVVNANLVVVLEHGKIVQMGTHHQLLQQEGISMKKKVMAAFEATLRFFNASVTIAM